MSRRRKRKAGNKVDAEAAERFFRLRWEAREAAETHPVVRAWRKTIGARPDCLCPDCIDFRLLERRIGWPK